MPPWTTLSAGGVSGLTAMTVPVDPPLPGVKETGIEAGLPEDGVSVMLPLQVVPGAEHAAVLETLTLNVNAVPSAGAVPEVAPML